MPIVTHCPKCRATFNLPDSLAGKSAKCSRCQQVFVVPAAPAAVPTAELVDDVPMAQLAEDAAGAAMSAEPLRSPSRPEPPHDPFPERRRPYAPPRRSGSGAGWIIALAVGLPVLLILLVGCGVGGFLLFAVYSGAQAAKVAVGATPVPTIKAAPPMIDPAPVIPDGPGPLPPDAFNPPPPVPFVPPLPKPRDPPPALKPPTPIETPPANLAQDTVVKQLPATIADMAIGGGGRFLILYLPQQSKLAIFDVSAAQVAKYLSFTEPNLKFAAGMDKLIVALPNSRVLKRYSLKTFEEEQSVPLPIVGDVDALCMGSASNGPLWVQPKGNQAFGGAPMLVEPSTLKEWPADWGDKRPPGGAAYIRASEDGQVFTLRTGVGGEPHDMFCITLADGRATVHQSGDVHSSILVPDADGRNLYAGCAVYNDQLNALFPNPAPQQFCKPFLPAVGGPYFVRLDYTKWDQMGGDLAFFTAGAQEPFATLKGVEGVSNEQIAYGANRDKLTHDQRVVFIPAAKVVVSIPKTNDRLILHRFDPDAALDKSDVDYLLVTSRPPTSARKGQEYAYSLAVKSKKGGVKYTVASGSKGMRIDAAGKLTWTPPADADAVNDVILSVTDAGGREAFQSFRVGVE